MKTQSSPQQKYKNIWHVCGLVLQVNPHKIFQIKEHLLTIPGTEVPVFDQTIGKIVVTMESTDQHLLLENMENTKNIDGVLSVSLVYHQQDDEDFL